MKRMLQTILLLSLSVIVCTPMWSQEKKSPTESETSSVVPELAQFHEVIFKIWHTAWPEKNVAMLKELAPEVNKLGSAVCNSKLPGILREKSGQWEVKKAEFRKILDEYQHAADSTSPDRLLSAAEKLHKQYESMVRALRPPLKEVEEFHAVLYPLYHYYLPQKDIQKIRESVVELRAKMDALSKATLPARLKERKEAFDKATMELRESLNSLEAALGSSYTHETGECINTMHSRYEALDKILE